MGLSPRACLPEVMISRDTREGGGYMRGNSSHLVGIGGGEGGIVWVVWVVLSVAFSVVDTAVRRTPTCQRANACMYGTVRVQLGIVLCGTIVYL